MSYPRLARFSCLLTGISTLAVGVVLAFAGSYAGALCIASGAACILVSFTR